MPKPANTTCGCRPENIATSPSARAFALNSASAAAPLPTCAPRNIAQMSGCGSCRDDYIAVPPSTGPPRPRAEISEDLIPASLTAHVVQQMGTLPEPCHLEQVAPKFMSADAYSPHSAPRVTQPGVGKFLVADNKRQMNMDSHVDDRVLNNWAELDKASWVEKPGVDAPYLYCLMRKFPMKHSFDPFFSHRSAVSVFPRAKQLELCNIAARNRAVTEVVEQLDCDCTQPKPCCKDYSRKTLAKCRTPPWWHQVPFWWSGVVQGPPSPVGDINEYSNIPIRDEDMIGHEPQDLMKILKLNRAGRYTPGEIFCEEHRRLRGEQSDYYNSCRPRPAAVTATPEATTADGETCNTRQWSRVHGGTVLDYVTPSSTRDQETPGKRCDVCVDALGKQQQVMASARDRCEIRRNEEMNKVGQPFRSDACKWQHQMYPSQRMPVVGRTPMKEFPHKRLTNL